MNLVVHSCTITFFHLQLYHRTHTSRHITHHITQHIIHTEQTSSDLPPHFFFSSALLHLRSARRTIPFAFRRLRDAHAVVVEPLKRALRCVCVCVCAISKLKRHADASEPNVWLNTHTHTHTHTRSMAYIVIIASNHLSIWHLKDEKVEISVNLIISIFPPLARIILTNILISDSNSPDYTNSSEAHPGLAATL